MTPGSVSPRERHAVLCALRLLQEELQLNPGLFVDTMPLGNILTNGGEDAAPSLDEIDALCHRINCT